MNMAYRGAALRAAIELDIFTAIAKGATTAARIGRKVRASERGVRIVCDLMVVMGFLRKTGGAYSLTPDSAEYMDKRSASYMGDLAKLSLQADAWPFLAKPELAVRAGGSVMGRDADMEIELPEWVEFARAFAPMMRLPAEAVAERLAGTKECAILEIAAGHGLFGIAIAKRNPRASVTAMDWPSVVGVARRNAARAGVAKRFSTIAGNVFAADLAGPYDLALISNFVHMLSPEQNVRMFVKAHASLKSGGRMALFEFVVNEDRVSPETSAMFAMAMLTATQGGDTYTFSEIERMCLEAGFVRCHLRPVANLEQRLVIAKKR